MTYKSESTTYPDASNPKIGECPGTVGIFPYLYPDKLEETF